jgi:hypothetical protein
MRTAIIAALLATTGGLISLGSVILLDLRLGVPPQSALPAVTVCGLCCVVTVASLLWGKPIQRRRGQTQKEGIKPATSGKHSARLQCAIILTSRAQPIYSAREESDVESRLK